MENVPAVKVTPLVFRNLPEGSFVFIAKGVREDFEKRFNAAFKEGSKFVVVEILYTSGPHRTFEPTTINLDHLMILLPTIAVEETESNVLYFPNKRLEHARYN